MNLILWYICALFELEKCFKTCAYVKKLWANLFSEECRSWSEFDYLMNLLKGIVICIPLLNHNIARFGGLFWIFSKENILRHFQISPPNPATLWFNNRIQMNKSLAKSDGCGWISNQLLMSKGSCSLFDENIFFLLFI